MTNDERRAWLDALKPGDRVTLFRGMENRGLAEVLRRTRARIVVRLIGRASEVYVDARRGALGDDAIRVPTADDIETHDRRMLREALLRRLGTIDALGIPTESLRAAADALGINWKGFV